MSIYHETIAIVKRDPRIASLLNEASEGDISITNSLLETEQSQGGTLANSINSRLWSCFVEYGWMLKTPAMDGMPTGLEMESYALTDLGRRAVPVAMSAALERNAE